MDEEHEILISIHDGYVAHWFGRWSGTDPIDTDETNLREAVALGVKSALFGFVGGNKIVTVNISDDRTSKQKGK